MMTADVISSRDARISWRKLLDRVLIGNQDVVIERNGQPVAVLIPVADYEAVLDTLEDIRSARNAAMLLEGWRRDHSTSRPVEEFEKELIAEGLIGERSQKDVEG